MKSESFFLENKGRLPFIDVTKGILVVFLVFHHVVNIAKGMMPVENMQYLTKADVLYAPYFMQAFFFIIGYCSSFQKKFSSFLLNNIKILLIPLLSFSIINQLIAWGIFGENFFWVSVLGKEFFFLAELYWFFSALFIAKMIMYGILKICNSIIIQCLLVFIVFIFAVSFNGKHFHAYNWFHWHNGFVDLLFLYIGFVFRKYNILCKYCLNQYSFCAYLLGVVCFIIWNKDVPYYTHFPHFYLKSALPFIYFSITGTLMIMSVGRIIGTNSKLNYLGRKSIVVYGMHFSILSIVIYLLSSFFIPSNNFEGLLFYVLVGGMTLLLSYYACSFFALKPFRYLIGKF